MTDQPTAGVALQPCPMCGKTPRVSRRKGLTGTAVKTQWLRETVACKCGLSITGKRPGSAITAWNTRTPASGAVEAADAVALWSDGIITDGERVAFAQKSATDHGETYWATDEGNGAIEWEPTHFIGLAALTSEPKAEGDKPVKKTMTVNLTDDELAQLEELDPGGWIVTNANGDRFRTWSDGYSAWTEKRGEAIRYYRREDAEAVHSEDEDAWCIVRFSDRSGDEDWKTCPHCFDVWNAK